MKASAHFVSVLTTGIRKLNEKFGPDTIAATPRWTIFYAVSDAVTHGCEHNAKILMDRDDAFHSERMTLKDVHIETAIKVALKATTV